MQVASDGASFLIFHVSFGHRAPGPETHGSGQPHMQQAYTAFGGQRWKQSIGKSAETGASANTSRHTPSFSVQIRNRENHPAALQPRESAKGNCIALGLKGNWPPRTQASLINWRSTIFQASPPPANPPCFNVSTILAGHLSQSSNFSTFEKGNC